VRGVAITLACFALIAVLLAWSRWLERRRLATLGHLALAAASASVAAVLWVITGSLASFEPWRPEVAVAELRFDAAGPGHYRATLVRLPEGRAQVLEVTGDRWRIEARTLEWSAPAGSLGLRPAYRLQQFEFGPADGTAAPAAPGGGYALAEHAGRDLWTRARDSQLWSRYVKAGMAETPWQPVARGAEFTVFWNGRMLVVEPAGADGPVLAPRSR
jgi:hypothetical protein